jgi:hypothetical protein
MSMVQVSGLTYRIVAGKNGTYDAFRLLDDVRMGSFRGAGSHVASRLVSDGALLRRIAQTAMRRALTGRTAAARAA